MSEPTGLEQGYRRLLAWYPGRFRSEQGEEMLAVLMAGARPGQRRPGAWDSVDVLRSAVGMRLRAVPAGLRNQQWADALALFSVAAPLFLLAADVLEVVLPYHFHPLRPDGMPAAMAAAFGPHEIGGLSLLRAHLFDVAVGCQVIIAALILLGLRWLALAAIAGSAGYLVVASQWIDLVPGPLQLHTAAVYLLTAAALLGSPGRHRGRQLLTWGHAMVLFLAAAAVQASMLLYEATAPPASLLAPRAPHTVVYFAASVVLAVAALVVAVVLRVNRYFLLLLAAMLYPYVMQVAYPSNSSSDDLLGHPTPSHLILLFLPPVLVACAALVTAALRWRAPLPAKPGQAGLA